MNPIVLTNVSLLLRRPKRKFHSAFDISLHLRMIWLFDSWNCENCVKNEHSLFLLDTTKLKARDLPCPPPIYISLCSVNLAPVFFLTFSYISNLYFFMEFMTLMSFFEPPWE